MYRMRSRVDMNRLKLGTRGSQLALWQAHQVARELTSHQLGIEVELVVIKTKGDKILDVALSKIGDKGLFTREIENALLAGEIDLAVHSMKDLPSILAPGLELGAVLPREDPRDVLISHRGYTLASLPVNAIVGTSSLRRIAQLRNGRPDLRITDLRGNIETRIRKMMEQDLDAIVLAYAGVRRLGLTTHLTEIIDTQRLLPAVGQGAIAIEVRSDDGRAAAILSNVNHQPTYSVTLAERAFLGELEGGCQVPIGCLGSIHGEELFLEGLIAALDGKVMIRETLSGRLEQAEAIGRRLGSNLLRQGGGDILRAMRQIGE